MLTARRSPDLVATVALALLALLVAIAPVSGWLAGLVVLPLAVLLPGYATTAALFPPKTIPTSERTVYVVSLGIAVSALSGVLAQILLSLDRTTWAIVLFLLTLAASRVATRRRDSESDAGGPRLYLPRFNPLAVALLTGALVLAAGATAIATRRAHDERSDAHFTGLWALSSRTQGGDRTAQIGVSNHEGRLTTYRVLVAQGGKSLLDRKIRLADGDEWARRVPVARISEARPLRVTLSLGGRLYRRVYLRNGVR